MYCPSDTQRIEAPKPFKAAQIKISTSMRVLFKMKTELSGFSVLKAGRIKVATYIE